MLVLVTSAARVLRWTAIAFALGTVILTGCGSGTVPQSAPAAVAPPALPPPIPSAEPILLFTGTGTSPNDVLAIEDVLGTLGVGYITADSSQLEATSERQLGGYKLLIVPGGNSITIGENLSAAATTTIRNAVAQYGLHYLGICAGAFFGGYSTYNGVDLTSGVGFDFFAEENLGIHKEAVWISFPAGEPLDVYWEDGPQLSGWGEVVAKYPDGTAAIVEGQSGNGFVIFTGIHAEAPAYWRSGMKFKTPVAVDVAYAGTLIQAALAGTPLPHF